jgi:predicted GH43/DUF377 family glycosyl hydrolase
MQEPIILAIIALCLIIIAILVAKILSILGKGQRPHLKLDRHHANPLISPQFIYEWEHGGTFNPAAFKDHDGTVHLLYRCVGADGISRVGYARSTNGRDVDDRCPYPVFEPLPGQGMPDPDKVKGPKRYSPAYYTSGGGWGGSEDPRTVLINDKVYMTYVAFEGWDSVRIGLTSILLDDLKNKRWKWRRPVLISKPNEIAKNWLIFPEKVNGKFAIIHSIVPKIMIEYVDCLDGIKEPISSPRPQGVQPGRKNFWDNRVRGSGPPPIKTDFGWLLLYHAQDYREPSKYKLGAMILDKDDPTKILYRSPQPILEPDAHYENDGKPGVIYASGAVILGEDLVVYYGGGDRHVCIAETKLQTLLNWLIEHGRID